MKLLLQRHLPLRALIIIILSVAPSLAGAAATEKLSITTNKGVRDFMVEIANTPERLERGLMNRKTIPEDTGMLFWFESERSVQMWMKNTPASLDMLFIRKNGTISHIAHSTVPESLDIITSDEPAIAVLELAGGSAKKYNINVGDKISDETYFHAR